MRQVVQATHFVVLSTFSVHSVLYKLSEVPCCFDFHGVWQTSGKERSHLRESDNSSVDHEIHRLFWDPKARYRVHEILPLVLNPAHTLCVTFLTFHFGEEHKSGISSFVISYSLLLLTICRYRQFPVHFVVKHPVFLLIAWGGMPCSTLLKSGVVHYRMVAV